MSLNGYGLYNPETGAPLDAVAVEKGYILLFASLSGRRFVLPDEDLSQSNESCVFGYGQGVLLGAEGRAPSRVYSERHCPCGKLLNQYNPGPLCAICQIQLLDPESQPDQRVLDFLSYFWPDLYKERELTLETYREESLPIQ